MHLTMHDALDGWDSLDASSTMTKRVDISNGQVKASKNVAGSIRFFAASTHWITSCTVGNGPVLFFCQRTSVVALRKNGHMPVRLRRVCSRLWLITDHGKAPVQVFAQPMLEWEHRRTRLSCEY